MYFLKYPHLFQLLFMHFLLGFKFFKIKKKMLKRAKQNTIQPRFCLEAPRWEIPGKTTPNPRKRSRQEASLRNIFMCTHTHAHARCRIEGGQDGRDREHPGATGTGSGEDWAASPLALHQPSLAPPKRRAWGYTPASAFPLTSRKVSKCSHLFYEKPLSSTP